MTISLGLAFNIGRITIVDSDCYDAMGRAFNEFTGLKEALSGVKDPDPDPTKMRALTQTIRTFSEKLNQDVFKLVIAAQENLSPAQTWLNQRRFAGVKRRLREDYPRYPGEIR